jgi:hypothetical protein
MKNTSRNTRTPSAITSRITGIKHRGHDFPAEFFSRALKVGDLRQHQIEEAAGLACLNHRRVNARECFGRKRHRIGERHTVNDAVVNCLPLFSRDRRRCFLVKNHQRAAQRHAGGKQAGKVGGWKFSNIRGVIFFEAPKDI